MVLCIIEKKEAEVKEVLQDACNKINAATGSNVLVCDLEDIISKLSYETKSIDEVAKGLRVVFSSPLQDYNSFDFSPNDKTHKIEQLEIPSLRELTNFCFLSDRYENPYEPIHGVQAHFFRFDPKKWHDSLVKLAPVITHRITYFYRKCWMQAKTFMNVHELETVI